MNISQPGLGKTGLIVLSVVAVLLPIAMAAGIPRLPHLGTLPAGYAGGSSFAPSKVSFTKEALGPAFSQPPWITNVQILDFDNDGLNDVIACDSRQNKVFWYRQKKGGGWEEKVLGENLLAPAQVTVLDLDKDGDKDVIVSLMGDMMPNDEVIGGVVLLEQVDGKFVRRTLLDDVRRVADVQGGDLDGDGDLDLAVAVVGYQRGQLLWLENLGGLRFRERELLATPGIVRVPLADYDGDGDLDIAAVASQDEEELWALENVGNKTFKPRKLRSFLNADMGSAGLVQADLDGDGDPDLILPVGSNLEEPYNYPQPYHGCLWFENQGKWTFKEHRIAQFGGACAAAVGDLDGDGDKDIALVSLCNDWDHLENATIIWLENDGHQEFKSWQIDNTPTHLASVSIGDLNGDGRADLVAGGLHLMGPYDRLGRVTAWLNGSRGAP